MSSANNSTTGSSSAAGGKPLCLRWAIAGVRFLKAFGVTLVVVSAVVGILMYPFFTEICEKARVVVGADGISYLVKPCARMEPYSWGDWITETYLRPWWERNWGKIRFEVHSWVEAWREVSYFGRFLLFLWEGALKLLTRAGDGALVAVRATGGGDVYGGFCGAWEAGSAVSLAYFIGNSFINGFSFAAYNARKAVMYAWAGVPWPDVAAGAGKVGTFCGVLTGQALCDGFCLPVSPLNFCPAAAVAALPPVLRIMKTIPQSLNIYDSKGFCLAETEKAPSKLIAFWLSTEKALSLIGFGWAGNNVILTAGHVLQNANFGIFALVRQGAQILVSKAEQAITRDTRFVKLPVAMVSAIKDGNTHSWIAGVCFRPGEQLPAVVPLQKDFALLKMPDMCANLGIKLTRDEYVSGYKPSMLCRIFNYEARDGVNRLMFSDGVVMADKLLDGILCHSAVSKAGCSGCMLVDPVSGQAYGIHHGLLKLEVGEDGNTAIEEQPCAVSMKQILYYFFHLEFKEDMKAGKNLSWPRNPMRALTVAQVSGAEDDPFTVAQYGTRPGMTREQMEDSERLADEFHDYMVETVGYGVGTRGKDLRRRTERQGGLCPVQLAELKAMMKEAVEVAVVSALFDSSESGSEAGFGEPVTTAQSAASSVSAPRRVVRELPTLPEGEPAYVKAAECSAAAQCEEEEVASLTPEPVSQPQASCLATPLSAVVRRRRLRKVTFVGTKPEVAACVLQDTGLPPPAPRPKAPLSEWRPGNWNDSFDLRRSARIAGEWDDFADPRDHDISRDTLCYNPGRCAACWREAPTETAQFCEVCAEEMTRETNMQWNKLGRVKGFIIKDLLENDLDTFHGLTALEKSMVQTLTQIEPKPLMKDGEGADFLFAVGTSSTSKKGSGGCDIKPPPPELLASLGLSASAEGEQWHIPAVDEKAVRDSLHANASKRRVGNFGVRKQDWLPFLDKVGPRSVRIPKELVAKLAHLQGFAGAAPSAAELRPILADIIAGMDRSKHSGWTGICVSKLSKGDLLDEYGADILEMATRRVLRFYSFGFLVPYLSPLDLVRYGFRGLVVPEIKRELHHSRKVYYIDENGDKKRLQHPRWRSILMQDTADYVVHKYFEGPCNASVAALLSDPARVGGQAVFGCMVGMSTTDEGVKSIEALLEHLEKTPGASGWTSSDVSGMDWSLSSAHVLAAPLVRRSLLEKLAWVLEETMPDDPLAGARVKAYELAGWFSSSSEAKSVYLVGNELICANDSGVCQSGCVSTSQVDTYARNAETLAADPLAVPVSYGDDQLCLRRQGLSKAARSWLKTGLDEREQASHKLGDALPFCSRLFLRNGTFHLTSWTRSAIRLACETNREKFFERACGVMVECRNTPVVAEKLKAIAAYREWTFADSFCPSSGGPVGVADDLDSYVC